MLRVEDLKQRIQRAHANVCASDRDVSAPLLARGSLAVEPITRCKLYGSWL